MPFETLNQRSTPENVADVIRRAILDGSLKPGIRLLEQHIANEMGISRAPVREALARLEDEGLVTKIPFRGAVVAAVGPEKVREIESLRERLEPFAVELALPALRDGGRDQLKDAVEALSAAAAAKDVAASIEAHLRVHRLFYELSGHQMLLGLWKGWEAQLRLFLAEDHRSFANLPAIARDHERLLALLDAGNDHALLREVTEHVRGSLLIGTPEAHAAPPPGLSSRRPRARRGT